MARRIEYDDSPESASDADVSTAAAMLGRKGGKARTTAKAEAARANGKKGGRPRKEKGE